MNISRKSRLFAVVGALVASLAVSGGTASARVPTGAADRAANSQTFSITSDDQQNQFVQAVGTPNATVVIAGAVNLNLSGLSAIPVAPGVRIIGDRTVVAKGPRIFTTTFPRTLLTIGDSNGGTADNVRISGIRFDGGEPMDPGASVGTTDANGIDIWSSQNVEIDHDEFARWRGAAINVQDPGNRINRANADTVWVHDNYIHDNQHPTMDGIEDAFGSHHGAGYGVALNNGAYALIEKNEFQANRHSVTGDGRPGTGYLVYRNLMESPGLGFSLLGWDHYEHLIDMHGRGDCSNYQCGPAGEYADIAYNSFPSTSSTEIKLRGTPSDGFNVENNVFAHTVRWSTTFTNGALDQTETGLHDNGGNILGANRDNQRTCDFDGDGVADPFMTTGLTWWYATSAGDQHWVYLNQSNERIADLRFRDVNGDGLCDATSVNTGKVYYTHRQTDDVVRPGNGLPTVAPVPGSSVAMASQNETDSTKGVQAFAVDAQGGLHTTHIVPGQPAPDWTADYDTPAPLTSVAAATNADGRIELFALDRNGQIYARSQTSPGSSGWSAWRSLDGILNSISVARNQNGTLQIFGTNSAGSIFTRSQLQPSVDNWNGWQQMDGLLTKVVAGTHADGTIEIDGINVNGTAFHRRQTTVNATSPGSGWAGWAQMFASQVPLTDISVAPTYYQEFAFFGVFGDAAYQNTEVSWGGYNTGGWHPLTYGSGMRNVAAQRCGGDVLLIGVTDDGKTEINEIGGGFIGGDYGWGLINGATARAT
ncbi:tectonin domain-containing protein [Streptomyces sp. NPDC005122]